MCLRNVPATYVISRLVPSQSASKNRRKRPTRPTLLFSEGRGQRFESSRVRQFFNTLARLNGRRTENVRKNILGRIQHESAYDRANRSARLISNDECSLVTSKRLRPPAGVDRLLPRSRLQTRTDEANGETDLEMSQPVRTATCRCGQVETRCEGVSVSTRA